MGRPPIHKSGPMDAATRQRRSRQRRKAALPAAPAAPSPLERAQLILLLSLLGSPNAVARATAAAKAAALLKKLGLRWSSVIKL
jgi:hypothetical protein